MFRELDSNPDFYIGVDDKGAPFIQWRGVRATLDRNEAGFLRDVLNTYLEDPKAGRVWMSENNSGGNWWLDEADYDALERAGWRKDGRRAVKFGISLEYAKLEFREVTGQDPDEQGCSCCGQPFNFYEFANDSQDWCK